MEDPCCCWQRLAERCRPCRAPSPHRYFPTAISVDDFIGRVEVRCTRGACVCPSLLSLGPNHHHLGAFPGSQQAFNLYYA